MEKLYARVIFDSIRKADTSIDCIRIAEELRALIAQEGRQVDASKVAAALWGLLVPTTRHLDD